MERSLPSATNNMKNLKAVKTLLKDDKTFNAFVDARKIEKATIKSAFENTCLVGKSLVALDKMFKSKGFQADLKKHEVKMTKKDFVKNIVGMGFTSFCEYVRVGNASVPQRTNFLKGCDKIEADGGRAERSIKNFLKFITEVKEANSGGEGDADGDGVEVEAKAEKSSGIFQLKLTIDGIAHDVRVDLTSKGGIKTNNEAQAIIKALDIFKAQVLQGLQSASDKAPKKVAKELVK